jgi:hypothetical protein
MRKTISCLVALLLSTGCTLILDTDNTGKRCSDQDVTCEPGYYCNFDTDRCEKESTQNDGGLDGEDGADGADGADQGPKPNGTPCSQNEECDSEYCNNGYCCWDFFDEEETTCCRPDIDCDNYLACDPSGNYCYLSCHDGVEDDDGRCIEGYHCDAENCAEDVVGGGTCDEDSDCVSGDCMTGGYCCEHAGLCCLEDEDCPDLFSNCSGHAMYTCVYMTFHLPDTGQTKCYTEEAVTSCPDEGNDYYGQDAQHEGNTRTYTDNGDTVTDEVTGLRWLKAAQSTTSWDDANAICSTDNTEGRNWRLPKRHELQSLVDYGVETGVMIDAVFSPLTEEHLFWTSTGVSGEDTMVWVVDFKIGYVQQSNKTPTELPWVRCVEQL